MSSSVGISVESSGISGTVSEKFRYGSIKTYPKGETEKESQIVHIQQRRHYTPSGPTQEFIEKPHIRINGPASHEDIPSGVKKIDPPPSQGYIRKEKAHVFYEPKNSQKPAQVKVQPPPEMKFHFQKAKRTEGAVEQVFKKNAKPSTPNDSTFLVCGSEGLKKALFDTNTKPGTPLVTRNEQLSGVITRDAEMISPFENKLTKLDKAILKDLKKKEMGDIYKDDIELLKTLK